MAEHDRLVRAFAFELVRNRYFVRADRIDLIFPPIPSVAEKIPDVVGSGKGMTVVAEAETRQSLSAKHTRNQWQALSLATLPLTCEFHVIVPANCVGLAQSLAVEWGIRIDYWW